MSGTLIVLLMIGLIITGIFISPILVVWRRDRIKGCAFPPLWGAVVAQSLPIYDQLTPTERRQLQGHIQVFLAEKQFIGCGGLQITLEMKVTIASVACLLLLNERGKYFANLRSILVYPDAYFVQQTTAIDAYIVEEERVARLGESWSRDQVVLSWAQVEYDTTHWQDGRNVVLHEFAHQLDQEDGRAEGVPILPHATDYQQWAQVMTEAYQQLCDAVQRGGKTLIDRYGATNPAEFFAVVTETFFEQPHLLLKQYPLLYRLLQHYYHLDPTQWSDRKF